MWLQRLVVSGLCVPALCCGVALANAQTQTGNLPARAASLVMTLGADAAVIISDKSMTTVQRVDRFRSLFQNGFDVPTIARFALGRYWNGTTLGQQQEYLRQFEDFVVRSYAVTFDSYGSVAFRIASSRFDGGHDVFVVTFVKTAGRPPITLEWRVRQRDDHLGIIDVAVEGVSMSLSERQEFSSVIQAKGGNFDAFLRALRDKNAALASSVP